MAKSTQIQQEIVDWYKAEADSDEEVYFDEAWPEFNEMIWGSGTVDLPSGEAKTLDSYGGEGKGDEYWVVFQVGEKIYRVDGYYSSWEGVNWESAEPYEVKPVEVTVIEYKEA